MQELSEVDTLPAWLQAQLATRVPVGQRNNHCIEIAPALMRHGYSPEQARAALLHLYPEATDRELDGVIRRAIAYAKTDAEFGPEYFQERVRLRKIQSAAEERRDEIIKRYQMPDLESCTMDYPLIEQRKLFIRKMFKPDDIIWIGGTYSSGPSFARCFRPAVEWAAQPVIPGEFVSHSTFQPDAYHRNKQSIKDRRYLVVESDILHPSDLANIAHYLQMHHELVLRAIVSTGGKRHAPAPGLHFWFDYPGDASIEEWGAKLQGYGADVATLRGPQPVRLPGCVRLNTHARQELLWIKE